MREWLWRLRAMIGRREMTAVKEEELWFHFDMEVEAGLREGLSSEEAQRRARLRVGLVSEGLEAARGEMGFQWLDSTMLEFRHAARALTRNRGFGSVAMLVLAASVAINTLVFCMLDGVVLRPLPYREPDRLVRLYDASQGQPKFPPARARFLEYRAHSRSLAAIALYTGVSLELTAKEGRSRKLEGLAITSDYFSVLGAVPFLGTTFTDADLRKGVHKAIISHSLWREQFQSDPAIAGKTVRINREAYTVVGVAPRNFQHVGGDYRSPLQGETVDIWVPLEMDDPDSYMRGAHFTNAVGRVRDGFTFAQAKEDLRVLAANDSANHPAFGNWTVRVEPLLSEVTGRSREVIWLLAAAGALVLLTACVNIAGLCVARAVARRKELSLRRALGANRWQLLRVGLAENLLIGLAGAALGIGLARAGLPLLRQLLPATFPRAHEVTLTWLGDAFAVTIALITVLLAGLLPLGDTEALESQRVTAGRKSRRLRTALVAGQVAVAGLLCAGALFLLHSYREIGARDHGFQPDSTLTFQINVPPAQGSKPGEVARLYDNILLKIQEIPGVRAAGATTNLPWSGYDENSGFTIVGQAQPKDDGLSARYQAATPDYFRATGMRLLDGRVFDRAHDVMGQPNSVIVNDALASRYFPDGKAVGAIADVFGQKRQIIGAVAGIRDYPADLDVKPAFWLPLGQEEFREVFFAVRTSGVDPASLTAAVTSAVHAADPELAVAEVFTLQARADRALAARKFALWLFQVFALLSLALAGTGIYGLLAYLVQQQRKELGIRVALGASRAALWKMILGNGLRMASVGAIACLLLIPVGGSLLRSFLFQVRAFDPFTIAGTPLALLVVALAASLGPAWSAVRGDPAVALREE